jgi:hypothetical protein
LGSGGFRRFPQISAVFRFVPRVFDPKSLIVLVLSCFERRHGGNLTLASALVGRGRSRKAGIGHACLEKEKARSKSRPG